ncbi:IS3 family transposase [Poseidonocella sp. HB161398]|uniref:IS3 family transposase n=1 Tax=Poseidonocella sp. HB161398 TaxID=2320855 RepID=UPI0011087CCC
MSKSHSSRSKPFQVLPRTGAPKRAARRAARERLQPKIRKIFKTSLRRYGAPRIHAEFRDRGIHVTRKTVAKRMKDRAIVRHCPRTMARGRHPPRRGCGIPRTTDSRHNLGIAPNLLRKNSKAAALDRIWLADISSVPTDEGWLHIAAVKEFVIVSPLVRDRWRTQPWRSSPPSRRLQATACRAAGRCPTV